MIKGGGAAGAGIERVGAPGAAGDIAIALELVTIVIVFRDQAIIRVEIVGSGRADGLADAPAQWVIVIVGNERARAILDVRQAVLGTIKVISEQRGARRLRFGVAIGIIGMAGITPAFELVAGPASSGPAPVKVLRRPFL